MQVLHLEIELEKCKIKISNIENRKDWSVIIFIMLLICYLERSDPKGHGAFCIFECENILMVFWIFQFGIGITIGIANN